MCVGERLHETRENPVEHHGGEVAGDPLLVAASLRDRLLNKRRRRPSPKRERLPPEQQPEHTETIPIRLPKQLPQVGLEETIRPWPRPLVIQTPNPPVRQQPPTDTTIGDDISRRQIPQHLAVRRTPTAAAVERAAEPLALPDHHRIPETIPGVRLRGGQLLRLRVSEQQKIRDIPTSALLG